MRCGRPPRSPAAASDVTVIIYGADWCKPCHQAEDYLRSKGVRVVKKDVEGAKAFQEKRSPAFKKS